MDRAGKKGVQWIDWFIKINKENKGIERIGKVYWTRLTEWTWMLKDVNRSEKMDLLSIDINHGITITSWISKLKVTSQCECVYNIKVTSQIEITKGHHCQKQFHTNIRCYHCSILQPMVTSVSQSCQSCNLFWIMPTYGQAASHLPYARFHTMSLMLWRTMVSVQCCLVVSPWLSTMKYHISCSTDSHYTIDWA